MELVLQFELNGKVGAKTTKPGPNGCWGPTEERTNLKKGFLDSESNHLRSHQTRQRDLNQKISSFC